MGWYTLCRMPRKRLSPKLSFTRKLEADRQRRHRARVAEHFHRDIGITGRPPLLTKAERSYVLEKIRNKLLEGNSVAISYVRQFVFLNFSISSFFILLSSIFFFRSVNFVKSDLDKELTEDLPSDGLAVLLRIKKNSS
jgi:hypothetical protein